MISDQQLVTGIALLASGYSQFLCRLSSILLANHCVLSMVLVLDAFDDPDSSTPVFSR